MSKYDPAAEQTVAGTTFAIVTCPMTPRVGTLLRGAADRAAMGGGQIMFTQRRVLELSHVYAGPMQ